MSNNKEFIGKLLSLTIESCGNCPLEEWCDYRNYVDTPMCCEDRWTEFLDMKLYQNDDGNFSLYEKEN